MVKTLPWTSVVLLLFSYSTLGWALSEVQASWYVWLTCMFGILLLVASLTVPWSAIAKYSSSLVGSNLRTFAATTFGALLFFLMLAWFRRFLDSLLIISAGILARIDFQTAGFKQEQVFLIIFIFSLGGLALGKALHVVLYHYF